MEEISKEKMKPKEKYDRLAIALYDKAFTELPFRSPIVIDESSEAYKIFVKYRDQENKILIRKIFEEIAMQGIHVCSDKRFAPIFAILDAEPDKCPGDLKITYNLFEKMFETSDIIARALQQNLVVPNFENFCNTVELLYQSNLVDTTGAPARHSRDFCQMSTDDLWGLAMYSTDGQKFLLGDHDPFFTLDSCCRPFLYALVMDALGIDVVHNYCGCEPVPKDFEEMMLNREGKPYTPLNIGGALLCCALWQSSAFPRMSRADKFEKFICILQGFTGGKILQCNNVMVIDAKEKSHIVRGVLHNLLARSCFPKATDIEATMEFYFQIASLEVNCKILALMGATLANNGVNPLTNQQVIKPEINKFVLALIQSTGVYRSGQDYLFDVGLPTIFSESGASIFILPGFFSFGLYSPFLNEYNMSVRCVSFCNTISRQFSFHPFDHKIHSEKIRPEVKPTCTLNCTLFNAAATGDIETVARLLATGVSPTTRDYMRRTILHEAATNGHLLLTKFIMLSCPNLLELKDNMNHTAYDDAKLFERDAIVEHLKYWLVLKRPAGESRVSLTKKESVKPSETPRLKSIRPK